MGIEGAATPSPYPSPRGGEGTRRDTGASSSPLPPPGGGAGGEGVTPHALTRLLAWLSPSFPTGAFAYSHALEAAVDAGRIRTAADLAAWVGHVVAHGAGRTDGMLFAAVWRAVTAGDRDAFLWAAERADAMRATAELALESRAQGTAFLDTVAAAWPDPRLDPWRALLAEADRPPAHAVAVATASAVAGVPLVPALAAFLHAVAANLVSAGVRLVPLGQTDGQRALAALEPEVLDAAARIPDMSLDDLGGAAPMVDLLSMVHETQYTRLFRS